jgi:hypothetical protein
LDKLKAKKKKKKKKSRGRPEKERKSKRKKKYKKEEKSATGPFDCISVHPLFVQYSFSKGVGEDVRKGLILGTSPSLLNVFLDHDQAHSPVAYRPTKHATRTLKAKHYGY